jgi:hypothetical protein
MAQPGVNISKAKSSTAHFATRVSFINHFTEEGKIDRVREYWTLHPRPANSVLRAENQRL